MVYQTLTPLQFGVPGGMELAVILLIAVLLFGANKIPKLARSTGQAMGEFRRGREEIEQELQEVRNTADIEADVVEETEPASAADEAAEPEETDETDESK